MFYTPHILQKKVSSKQRDEYGRIIASDSVWVELCRCRCDDSTQTEITSDNGHTFRPSYHIVCEGHPEVVAGEQIRCVNSKGAIRGVGKCQRTKVLNYLDFTELWV